MRIILAILILLAVLPAWADVSYTDAAGLPPAQVTPYSTESATAPVIASGFGATPSVVASNGTAVFTINVGTGGTASSGVLTMPADVTGWACTVQPNGAPQAAAAMYSAPTSATSITITNYTATTALALAWPSGFVVSVQCRGY
jgi:phage-related tail fiber protein